MKSLVVGMGIGQLYKSVLTELGYEVITVDSDPSKQPDFISLEHVFQAHNRFDTVNICTPNFTHRTITKLVAPHCDIVFVEKPGFKNSAEWQETCAEFNHTRIMMVKNNMWRDNIVKLQRCAKKSDTVNINWIRKNCIPNPGSWFTTKELAYGGVSRDLMPHLLSLYIAMNPKWRNKTAATSTTKQQWKLENIDSTDYGVINHNGTYDVDDYANLRYGKKWNISANWRDLTKEESCVKFVEHETAQKTIELGWCPESAFSNMIKAAADNLTNDAFWQEQLEQDIWIHKQVELL